MKKKMNEMERSKIKKKILYATKTLIENNGFDSVSIRKVAKLAGYTEGNIYNYFDDKESLVMQLVYQEFQEIMKATMIKLEDGLSIEEEIIKRFISYTKTALTMPEYYKEVMLSNHDKVLELTAILPVSSSNNQKGIEFLKALIEKGMNNGEFNSDDPALVAQIIWTATFGLILRIIVESKSSESMLVNQVEKQLRWILGQLRKDESNNEYR